ncbi:MAG: hypothetical protein ACOC5T_01700 [Elusimicrobiota bacterium]
MAKKWYQSKTIWANILLVLGGSLTAIAGQLEAGAGITLVGVIEIVLRRMTKEKIS